MPNRRGHLLLPILLLLTACSTGVSSPSVSHPSGHAVDPVAESVKSELSQRLGMTFRSAGPHHVLGTARNGVQLDLVGVPVVQVVLSVPADAPARIDEVAAPYLPYLPRLLNTDQTIGADLLLETAATWDGAARVDKRRTSGTITARLTSGGAPPFLVLSVTRD